MSISHCEILLIFIFVMLLTGSVRYITLDFFRNRKFIAFATFTAAGLITFILCTLIFFDIQTDSLRSKNTGESAIKNPTLAATVNNSKKNNQNKPPEAGDKIYLRLFKQEGILEMWYQHHHQQYQLYKTWKICTFSGGLGPKKAEGDGKSPEGFYSTQKNLLNPNSNYHLSFNIGYPNAYDRANGYTGSYIMIHGKCVSIGCYAMSDIGIEQIYSLVSQALDSGQQKIPIHIFPFKMNQANMKKHQYSKHYPFWLELKPAYDLFESQRRLPAIKVHKQHYLIN